MIGSRPEDRKFFKRFKINYAIYDEGHLLKNCTTQRYKNLMKVRVRTLYVKLTVISFCFQLQEFTFFSQYTARFDFQSV